jgi:hypothetical protein
MRIPIAIPTNVATMPTTTQRTGNPVRVVVVLPESMISEGPWDLVRAARSDEAGWDARGDEVVGRSIENGGGGVLEDPVLEGTA